MSFFRDTLPHWTGPSFFALIIFAAAFLDEKYKSFIPKIVQFSFGLYILTIVLGIGAVNLGWFFNNTNYQNTTNNDDITLDLYGWEQINSEFQKVRDENPELESNLLVGKNWFPSSHFDFYIARPQQMDMFVFGSLDQIHQYYWINKQRGGIIDGSDAWYITTNHLYNSPTEILKEGFSESIPIDTISVQRNGVTVESAFVYYLRDFKGE